MKKDFNLDEFSKKIAQELRDGKKLTGISGYHELSQAMVKQHFRLANNIESINHILLRKNK